MLEFKVALDITHGLLETSGEPQSKFLIQQLKFPKVKNCCSSIDIWGVLWLHIEETPWRTSCITSLGRPSMTYKWCDWFRADLRFIRNCEEMLVTEFSIAVHSRSYIAWVCNWKSSSTNCEEWWESYWISTPHFNYKFYCTQFTTFFFHGKSQDLVF